MSASKGERTRCTKQIGCDGEETDTETAKGGGDRDDALQFLVHAILAVTRHDVAILFELLRDIERRRARNGDPQVGEECARE